MLFFLFWNQLPIRFFLFVIFPIFFLPFFFFITSIGGLNLEEQTILVNFYNSLTSKGNLNWNVINDLCGQSGVVCDNSNPKTIIQLYNTFFPSFFLKVNKFGIFLTILMEKKKNRNLSSQSLIGTIPTEFGGLTKLQQL